MKFIKVFYTESSKGVKKVHGHLLVDEEKIDEKKDRLKAGNYLKSLDESLELEPILEAKEVEMTNYTIEEREEVVEEEGKEPETVLVKEKKAEQVFVERNVWAGFKIKGEELKVFYITDKNDAESAKYGIEDISLTDTERGYIITFPAIASVKNDYEALSTIEKFKDLAIMKMAKQEMVEKELDTSSIDLLISELEKGI